MTEGKRFLVYVAGPYSGNIETNVRAAINAAEELTKLGMVPFIPHLCHYWDALHHHDYEFWMEQVDAWLHVCDALYRMPGQSVGADREVKKASALGIPVFLTTNGIAVYKQTLA